VWDAPDFNAPLPDAIIAAFYDPREMGGKTQRRVRSRPTARLRRSR
jgi:hypothetical protein